MKVDIEFDIDNLEELEKVTKEIFALDIYPDIPKEELNNNIKIMRELAKK